MKLSERLEARAAFEDNRVLDEAKAMGFVPEVYTGSQTGALLREAAEFARRVEEAPVVELPSRRSPALEGAALTITSKAAERMGLDGQRVRLVPEQVEG